MILHALESLPPHSIITIILSKHLKLQKNNHDSNNKIHLVSMATNSNHYAVAFASGKGWVVSSFMLLLSLKYIVNTI